MLRKYLSIVTLLCALVPVGASAASWQLNTWVKSAGGIMSSRNNAAQTSANGSVFRTYTTSKNLPVTVTANTGYAITNVTQNGVTVATSGTSYATTVAGPTAQSVFATFGPMPISVTANAGSGGSVTPMSVANIYYGQKPLTALRFTFTPSAGFRVENISGVQSGMTVSSALPAPINTAVVVTIPTTFTFTSNVALVGTFSGPPIANAGTPQTVPTSLPVTLSGSGGPGTITSYAWSQTLGPTVTLTGANTATPTFTPTVAATYQFQLIVTSNAGQSPPAAVYVFVTNQPSAVARSQCQNCHTANGIGAQTQVFPNWSSSRHNNPVNAVLCANCHTGAGSGSHPGPAPATLGNICRNCHTDAQGNVINHPFQVGTYACTTCHNAHSTQASGGAGLATPAHFNSETTGMYPASYVTSQSSCNDCHQGTAGNLAKRQEWAASSHGATTSPAWIAQDFKTLNGCVQCHTTTGFVAYSTARVTSAWGVASDYTKEVLTCKACHSDGAAGTVRTMPRIRPYPFDPYTTPDMGRSNICVPCHAGVRSGTTIKGTLASGADFTNLSFLEPHRLPAAGTLNRAAGYQFAGRTYGSYTGHIKIGRDTDSGACAVCHISAATGHNFKAEPSNPVCAGCHFTYSATRFSDNRTVFATALQVLRAQLSAKGYTYSATEPSFTATNWGSGQAGADTMGAAFNYALLASEPGAFAHDPAYAKKLILDSIDYLDNGVIDDSIATIALPALVGSGAITQDQANTFISYKNGVSCVSCHNGTVATGRPMATNAHGTHLTSDYGPGGFLGPEFPSCQACHSYGSDTHMNGTVNLVTGAASACAKCHPGSIPSWTAAGRLACTDCHAAVPSTLPNGVAAPFKASFTASGHGKFAASNQCTACHNQNSGHISGALGDNVRLLLPNDNTQCASCHNDPEKVSARALNMTTHLSGADALACSACHDPHGTANLSMIRASINGLAIDATDLSTKLVDTVTNQGLCQVCHTRTNHYRSGVAETSHPTRDCLNCHSHNSTGGAFKPVGGCNACHGYPPAPRIVSYPVTFGIMSNWSSARFEDYSGGGGAHLVPQHVAPTVSPQDGWTNCVMCHSGGPDMHQTTLPMRANISNVTVKIDSRFRFDNSFVRYSGAKLVNPPADNATGSCFNVSCHIGLAPRWSIER